LTLENENTIYYNKVNVESYVDFQEILSLLTTEGPNTEKAFLNISDIAINYDYI
jgi:hypothetical protein